MSFCVAAVTPVAAQLPGDTPDAKALRGCLGLDGPLVNDRRDADAGIAACTSAIQASPQPNLLLLLVRGSLYACKRDFNRALADYNESIRLQPLPPAFIARGTLFLENGKLREAIGDFDTAVESLNKIIAADPKPHPNPQMRRLGLADPLYLRGMAKWYIGDKKGGDADIAEAKLIRDDIADQTNFSKISWLVSCR